MEEKERLTYQILFTLTDMTEEQRAEYRKEIEEQRPDALPLVDAAIKCARTYKGNVPISEILSTANKGA